MSKFLYITHEEAEATGKLPFIENETAAALIKRSLALNEISPLLPFSYKATISIDGGKTFVNNDNKTKLTEYPKRGDVTLRITKKPARLYIHFFDSEAAFKNNFDEPAETVAIKVNDTKVQELEKSSSTLITPGLLSELLSSSSATANTTATTKFTSALLQCLSTKTEGSSSSSVTLYARSGTDGDFDKLDTTTNSNNFLPYFPNNGDIFVTVTKTAAKDIITPAALQQAMIEAQELVKKQRFASAAAIFDHFLDMLPTKEDKLSEAALPLWHQLSIIYSEQGARIPEKAVTALRHCLKITRKMSGKDAAKQAFSYASNLAKELFNAKQYRDAANMFQEAFDLVRGDVKISDAVVKELRIRMGASLYMGNAKPQGMQLVQEAIAGDTNNALGVYWMSKFYAEMDHDQDALQWAATLLLKQTSNKDYRQNFAEIVSGIPDAISILKNNIITGKTPQHAQIWCFFGLIINEAGFLKLSSQFYETGIEIDPDNAGYALNYVHVLEHNNKLQAALDYIVKFLEKRGDVKLGMNKRFEPTPLAVARGIRGLDISDKIVKNTGAAADGDENTKQQEETAESSATAATVGTPLATISPAFPTDAIRFKSNAGSKEQLGDFHHCLYFKNASDADTVPAIAQEAKDEHATKRDTRPAHNALFGEDDLNVAGLYFTAVKLLFVIGALDRLPSLVALINPLRLHQQFHETKMKNEHSYYSTISLAVQYLTLPRSALSTSPMMAAATPETEMKSWMADASRCIYYVGDSHSVAPSWHVIENSKNNNNKLLIVNRLVTGLKIWHIRPESNFYPKRQFEAVTASLPQSSTCIFNFGEIDCREAAFNVVERGLYKSSEEVFEHLANIYIQVLLDVKRLRRLSKVIVLGPLPTIDVTRHLVVKCNKVFGEIFAKRKDCAQNNIVFIDVCDKLLCSAAEDPSGTRSEVCVKAGEPRVLRSEFHLDRTHLHPVFVSKVLEPALNEFVF